MMLRPEKDGSHPYRKATLEEWKAGGGDADKDVAASISKESASHVHADPRAIAREEEKQARRRVDHDTLVSMINEAATYSDEAFEGEGRPRPQEAPRSGEEGGPTSARLLLRSVRLGTRSSLSEGSAPADPRRAHCRRRSQGSPPLGDEG
jgi:hypothetical protein